MQYFKLFVFLIICHLNRKFELSSIIIIYIYYSIQLPTLWGFWHLKCKLGYFGNSVSKLWPGITSNKTNMHVTSFACLNTVINTVINIFKKICTGDNSLYLLLQRTFVVCTEFDSREISNNGKPIHWWPHSMLKLGFWEGVLLLCTIDFSLFLPNNILYTSYYWFNCRQDSNKKIFYTEITKILIIIFIISTSTKSNTRALITST